MDGSGNIFIANTNNQRIREVGAVVLTDGDCVPDSSDLCPGTPAATVVDGNGCSDAQVDADGDGVCDPAAPGLGPSACTGSDDCPGTGAVAVDAGGCSDAQVDADGDGVCDPAAPGVGPSACTGSDDCPGDPEDLDGVLDADGCPGVDEDGDGIDDTVDETPTTASSRFSDLGLGGATAGSMVSVPAGMGVAITEAANPAGVRVVVTGGSFFQRVLIRLDGKSGFYWLRAGTYVLTDPQAVSTVTTELGGPAEIEIPVDGTIVLVVIDPGETALITETFDGSELLSVTVESLDGVITVDGQDVGEGDAPLEVVEPPAVNLGAGLGAVIAGGAQQARENRETAAAQQQISPPSTGDAGLASSD